MKKPNIKRRPLISVFNHPTFVPNVVPPAPKLEFRDQNPAPSLGEVLFFPLDELRAIPVGYLNLVCATMLPDTVNLDIPACMRTLGEWALQVKQETETRLYQFRRNPAEYNNSEAYFRILMMITVLQCDFGVTYDPECAKTTIFKSSREGFIHGLLTGDRRGTCANMPVLYLAVGRLLGYPLYLVAARGHLFCRWQSLQTGERFNIEASGIGLTVNSDDYYCKWPLPITDAEVYHGIYLRSFDPAEELGCFMATRGHVLQDHGHILDAIVAYSHAHRLSPVDPNCTGYLLDMLNKEIDLRRDQKMPSSYRQAENFAPDVYSAMARFVIDERYTRRATGAEPTQPDSKILPT